MKLRLYFVLSILLSVTYPTSLFAKSFLRVESEHFIVTSGISEENTRRFVENLENFRTVLNAVYFESTENKNTNPKLEIYLLNDNDFSVVMPKKPSQVAGVMTYCTSGLHMVSGFYGNSVQKTKDATNLNENDSQIILFHEYSHVFMFQLSGPIYPAWFIEGFADFYGTVKVTPSNAVIGMAPSMRVSTLSRGLQFDYDYLLRDERPKNMSYENYMPMLYAQSWLLTHYLLSDNERRKKFANYLIAIHNGEDRVAAFEKYVGIKTKDLPKILGKYDTELKANVYNFKENLNPGTISFSKLPDINPDLVLWDASLRTCLARKHKEEVLHKIQNASLKYADNLYVQEILAHAELIAGDKEKALNFYKERVEQNPNNPEHLFRLGQAYYALAQNNNLIEGLDKKQQIAKARSYLYKSYKLDSYNTENLFLFSLTSPNGYINSDEASFNAAIEAFRIAPTVSEYAINVAYMLIGSNENDSAREILKQFANSSHNRKFATSTKEAINAIDAGGKPEEIIAKIKNIYSPSKDGKDDEDNKK